MASYFGHMYLETTHGLYLGVIYWETVDGLLPWVYILGNPSWLLTLVPYIEKPSMASYLGPIYRETIHGFLPWSHI